MLYFRRKGVREVAEIRVEIPNELHRRLKMKAVSDGSSVQQVVITTLQGGLPQFTEVAQVTTSADVVKPVKSVRQTKKHRNIPWGEPSGQAGADSSEK